MKKSIIFTMSLILALAMFSYCHAANTVTFNASAAVVSVVPDGSTDFDMATVSGVPTLVHLKAIVFQPSAANDKIQVRAGSATGAVIWPANPDVLGAGQVLYFDNLMVDPYIVASECTFGTAANAKITLIYSIHPGPNY